MKVLSHDQIPSLPSCALPHANLLLRLCEDILDTEARIRCMATGCPLTNAEPICGLVVMFMDVPLVGGHAVVACASAILSPI